MIWPQPISLCTSTIESAVYENRTYSAVRGRRLVTASYSIKTIYCSDAGQGFMPLYKREKITDDLHEISGFRTDYQFHY